MKKLFILISLILISSAGFSQVLNTSYKEKLAKLYSHTVPLISVSELTTEVEKGERPVILDTRQREEYNVSHIPTARFVNYSRFSKADVADIPRETKIIVYCSVGYRSEKIGEKLKKLGYTNVYNLYGGIFEWVNQEHQVVAKGGTPTMRVHTYNRSWSKWLEKGIRVW